LIAAIATLLANKSHAVSNCIIAVKGLFVVSLSKSFIKESVLTKLPLASTLLFTKYLSGFLAGLSVVFIWSGWIVFSRSGLQSQLTAADITLLRFVTAALVTLPWAIRYRWKGCSITRVLVVALGCGFPYTLLSFWGISLNSAANAGVLVNGSLPAITAILAVFWQKAKLSKALWIVIVAMIISNALLLFGARDGWQLHPFGLLLLLSAAVVLSTYMMAIKRWSIKLSDIIVWIPLVNAVLFFPIWLVMPSSLMSAALNDIAFQMIYQGLVVSVCGLLLFSFSVQKLGALNASFFMAFVPVVTAFLATAVLSEYPQPLQWLGITLCTVALAWYVFQQARS